MESKSRPLRLYGKNNNLFVYGEGKKSVKTSLKKAEAQKFFMNKLKGKIQPKGIIKKSERVLFRFTPLDPSIRLRPLEDAKSIPNTSDTDEGLKVKRRMQSEEKKIEEIKKKALEGKLLTDEEKQLLPFVHTVDKSKKDAQEKREEDIKEMLSEYNFNDVDFPIASWNGLNHGSSRILARNLNWMFKQLMSMTPHEVILALGRVSQNPIQEIPDAQVTARERGLVNTKSRYQLSQKGPGNAQLFNHVNANKMRNHYMRQILPDFTPELYNEILRTSPALFTEVRTIDNPAQIGTGKKLPALWNDEIEDYFADEKKYPHFGGVIASDQISELPKKLPIGFIMNLDGSKEEGSHWVAVYISGDSVEYFDPLGDPPTEQFKKDIKKYLESMKIPILMKFKINKVKWQNDSSYHCGWFCIQWLDNRFHGIPFVNATHFTNMSKEGEDQLKKEFEYI